MNLREANAAQMASFDIESARPSTLALYFHCYALASKLARDRQRDEGLDPPTNDPLNNALLEAFSQTFKAQEVADLAGWNGCLRVLREIVRTYLTQFEDAPDFYDRAFDQLREWQKRGEADDNDVLVTTGGDA